jgi:hypothetical protein
MPASGFGAFCAQVQKDSSGGPIGRKAQAAMALAHQRSIRVK